MKIIVDRSVWSLLLRRGRTTVQHVAAELLSEAISQQRVVMLGPIRQELLSGIRDRRQFDRLRDLLAAFPDLEQNAADHEHAAECFNTCRGRGVQGSNTAFLICAVALRRRAAILTTDHDFVAISRVLPIRLISVD